MGRRLGTWQVIFMEVDPLDYVHAAERGSGGVKRSESRRSEWEFPLIQYVATIRAAEFSSAVFHV